MAGPIGGNDDEPISAINIVPFVDIILVVLIIFMVTAPMVLKPVIDINLPKAASGEESAPTPLNIAITGTGDVSLNGKPSTLADVTAYATQLAQSKPDTAAILQADRTVTLETLTSIIDVVKTAGIKKVAFSIEKK
ncbi:MAG: biopolymer transporter ExbD [Proteobacteria bacterium]|nr:MAG: biopolymer transporter ExbD [Pseudomonadota bacterium]RYZ92206.1 MAG: biopolymer transporter ExbD [Pseudomonadota bacterium]